MVYLLPFDGTPRPVSFYQAVVRTGHQTNGALLVGGGGRADAADVSSSGRSTASRSPDCDDGPARRPEPAALDWEAVA